MSSIMTAALIGGGASILGGLISGAGARSAGSAQANADKYAANLQQQRYQTTQAQEQPFMQSGYGAQSQLNYLMGVGPQNASGWTGKGGLDPTTGSTGGGYGSLLKPFTIDDFHNYSPAYQFQHQQGLVGTLNGAADSVGSLAGGAQQGLVDYNNEMSNTAWANAFNQYQTQTGNIYQRLAGIADRGQNAVANVGTQGTALAGNAGSAIAGAGAATAAGMVGSANAWSSAAQGAGNAAALPWLWKGGGGNGYQVPADIQGGQAGINATQSQINGMNLGISDRRLKKNIVRIGATPGGQSIYEFEYIWGGGTQVGVMADESPEDAVIVGPNGFLMVDYARIV